MEADQVGRAHLVVVPDHDPHQTSRLHLPVRPTALPHFPTTVRPRFWHDTPASFYHDTPDRIPALTQSNVSTGDLVRQNWTSPRASVADRVASSTSKRTSCHSGTTAHVGQYHVAALSTTARIKVQTTHGRIKWKCHIRCTVCAAKALDPAPGSRVFMRVCERQMTRCPLGDITLGSCACDGGVPGTSIPHTVGVQYRTSDV
eukprot:2658318-Rhodomonas_salina.3